MNPQNNQNEKESIDLNSNENLNNDINNKNNINNNNLNNNNNDENKVDLSNLNNGSQIINNENNNEININNESNDFEKKTNENNNNESNESQIEDDDEQKENPLMILTIEVGNGKIEQLKLFNIDNPSKDVYEFCVKNKLDFYVMEEINKQVNEVIKQKNYINIENNSNSNNNKNNINNNNNNNNSNNNKNNNIQNNNNNNNNNKDNNNNNNKDNNFIDDNNNNLNSNKNPKNSKKPVLKNSLFPYEIPSKNMTQKYISKSYIFPNQKKPRSIKKISINNNVNTSNSNNNNNNNNTTNNINFDIEKLINSEILNIQNKNYLLLSNSNNKTISLNSFNNNKLNSISTSFPTKRSKSTKNNIGKEIYERQLKQQEKHKNKLNNLIKNLMIDENEISTFKPKINKISKSLCLKRKENKLECMNPDRITNYKTYYENKLNELKKKTENQKEKENLTFKPKINNIKNKKFIYNSSINSSNIYEKLYNDSSIYNENKLNLEKRLNSKFSYKPNLNYNINKKKIKDSFDERLKTDSNKRLEHKQKLINKKNEEINNLKQPHLFNNKKFNNNNNNNNNHYLDLYNYNNKYKTNKKILEDQIYGNYLKNPAKNKNSEYLLNKKNQNVYKNLFKILDSDEDGIISNATINTKKIDEKLCKILEPVFKELKEENETLNENEFVIVCEKLYKILPYQKKSYINSICINNNNNNNQNYNNNNKLKNNNNNNFLYNTTLNTNNNSMLSTINSKKNNKFNDYNNDFTFKPKINNNSIKISQGLTVRNLNSLNQLSFSSNNFQNSKLSDDLNKNLRLQTLENFNNYQRKYSGKNSEI